MQGQSNQTIFRSYLLFWGGQLVSLLGSTIAQFVIIWWITIQTESAVYLSIASLVGFAPIVVLSPFAGVLADRFNRKALIGIADFLQALTTLGLIFLFWLNMASIWLILLLLALRGIFQAFHYPTVMAITPSMVPKDKLSRLNGLNYLLTGAIRVIGPIIAVLLLDFWAIDQILWIDIATFLIAVVPLLIIMIPVVRKKQERTSFRKDFMEGFAFIKSTRGFMPLIILSTGLNFLVTPLSTLLPYYVKYDHLGGATEWAFVSAAVQGGMLAGGILMSITNGFKRKLVAITSVLYIFFAGYALVALTPTGMFWFMAVGGMIMLFCIPIVNVSYMTIVQTIIPLEMQGRVNSVDMALSSAATPVGMIISGPIAELIGTSSLFLGCSLSGILILTLSWFFSDIKHVEDSDKT
jgi:DHA3 family macrolide efflux protein-like MFS transporter